MAFLLATGLLTITLLAGTFVLLYEAWVVCRVIEWLLHKDVSLAFMCGAILLLNIVGKTFRGGKKEKGKKEESVESVFKEGMSGYVHDCVYFTIVLLVAWFFRRLLGA